jgi:prepilin-type N-terminal cleavage/methylation domain-containing protein
MTSIGSKQSGFSIVEFLIVIVVIGLFAVGSWAVYQRTKQRATRTGAASNPSQSNTSLLGRTVTYLDIREWGIKLPLSDTIRDAYYVPGDQNRAADGTPLAMYIGMKSYSV